MNVPRKMVKKFAREKGCRKRQASSLLHDCFTTAAVFYPDLTAEEVYERACFVGDFQHCEGKLYWS